MKGGEFMFIFMKYVSSFLSLPNHFFDCVYDEVKHEVEIEVKREERGDQTSGMT